MWLNKILENHDMRYDTSAIFLCQIAVLSSAFWGVLNYENIVDVGLTQVVKLLQALAF